MASKAAKGPKVPCAVCQAQIVDGKDEALLCEGECGQWFHRGCASIPPSRYKEVANSDEPFLCLLCTNLHLQQEIVKLKSDLAIAFEAKKQVETLANEVSALRQVMDSFRMKEPTKPAAAPTATI